MSNTINRATRRDRYVIIEQNAIDDARLSWAARGLLGYLLSRPDDWKVLVNDLRKRGDLGRDGIYKSLKELRGAGYIRFIRSRDKYGRIRGGTYFVHEIATSPHPVLPDTVEPDTASPCPVNPGALLTTDKNLRKTTTTIPTYTKEYGSSSEENNCPKIISWVPEDLHANARNIVAQLNPTSAQMVIDEWAGNIAAGRIETSPLGFLYALVKRFESGQFRLQCAEMVAEVREQEKADLSRLRDSGE